MYCCPKSWSAIDIFPKLSPEILDKRLGLKTVAAVGGSLASCTKMVTFVSVLNSFQ